MCLLLLDFGFVVSLEFAAVAYVLVCLGLCLCCCWTVHGCCMFVVLISFMLVGLDRFVECGFAVLVYWLVGCVGV